MALARENGLVMRRSSVRFRQASPPRPTAAGPNTRAETWGGAKRLPKATLAGGQADTRLARAGRTGTSPGCRTAARSARDAGRIPLRIEVGWVPSLNSSSGCGFVLSGRRIEPSATSTRIADHADTGLIDPTRGPGELVALPSYLGMHRQLMAQGRSRPYAERKTATPVLACSPNCAAVNGSSPQKRLLSSAWPITSIAKCPAARVGFLTRSAPRSSS